MSIQMTKTAVVLSLLLSNTAFASPIEVNFMRFFGDCRAEVGESTNPEEFTGECQIITALINKFNAENEGEIVIKEQSIAWANFYNTFKASVGSGQMPDLSVMHGSQLYDYVSRDIVMDLSDSFAEIGIDTQDFTQAAKGGFDYDGKYYALPWDTHAFVTYINRDLFEAAGLVDEHGEPIMPKNLAEMKTQAALIKEKTGALYLDGPVTGLDNGARHTLALTHQQGDDYISSHSVDFGKKSIKNGINALSELKKEGYLDVISGGELTNFMSGKVAMHIDGTWFMGPTQANAESGQYGLKNVEFRPYPTFFEQPAMWVDGHAIVMPKNEKRDLATQKAAIQFLKFMYENNVAWAKTGHFPTRQSALNDKKFTQLPGRQDVLDTTVYGVSMPRMSYVGSLSGNLSSQYDAVLLNDKSVEKAMSDAQSRSRTFIRRLEKQKQ